MARQIMPNGRPWGRRLPLLLVLALPLAGVTGCARDKQVIEFDRRFSINVVKTPYWFPGKRTPLSPAQEEVLFNMGRPDLIRFWWRTDGTLITSSDLTGRQPEELGRQLQTMDHSWIYLDAIKGGGREVMFLNNGRSYKVRPLDEILALVCKYGDPNDRSSPQIADGIRHETWRWLEFGIQVELVDGRVVNESHFQATGQGTWVSK